MKVLKKAGVDALVRRSTLFLFLLCTCTVMHTNVNDRWSWSYPKYFSVAERIANKKRGTCVFIHANVKPFTQLILSWNAQRPTRGHYTFWLQGRDARTKKWSSWHKVMAWGAGVQKSFLSSPDQIARNYHVRFEAGQGNVLDGFRIKVCANQGADLGGLHLLNAACANFKQFKNESVPKQKNWPSVRIKRIPRHSQFLLNHKEKKRLCSPTSCAMLVEFMKKRKCNIHHFAHNVFDSGLDAYGSWPFNVAHIYDFCKGSVWSKAVRLNSFDDLHKQLMRGIPIVVSVRGALHGAPKSYDNGHLLLVVGYDAKRKAVMCHDPASKSKRGTLRLYDLVNFIRAWERSRRLAYQIEMREQKQNT